MVDSVSSLNRRDIPAHWQFDTRPLPASAGVVSGENFRFTVLTSRLIRLEYSESGVFTDHASQLVLNRRFEPAEFRVVEQPDELQIITEHLHLRYDRKPFSVQGLRIQVRGDVSSYHSEWRYGQTYDDLGGTARTLDDVDGEVSVEPGLMSRNGFAVVDDSDSLVFEDGWLVPRTAGPADDLYFFGYGHSYRDCLADFYRLSGPTPLLPRFALGNWWSRYHAYTAEEYRALIDRFDAEGIPFSVAVLDMDWHLVDIDRRLGSGWTGYTWNTTLFPDPDDFAAWLHQRGLRLTLNVHPADGVRAHEDAYRAMAEELSVDHEAGDPVAFDVTNPEILMAYFAYLHHPLEERGIDFWWLDWQSGPDSKTVGMDPLWMLNHFHFLDSARQGRRPLTFSRYAGLGSHRYPVGFSGDTIATWASLQFQPYFTATAANVGYGWWSHDIGGHFFGVHDDDLAVRWTQLGTFSPVLRLHSSNNPYQGKEPWKFAAPSAVIIGEYLRLRHQLVPYLYTMNHLASAAARPLVEPMYYEYPEEETAYTVENQFRFGTELMVCPITTPLSPITKTGQVRAWLPDGQWVDFATGLVYRGGRMLVLHRGAADYPVLARAGAIVPLVAPSRVGNGTENPEAFEVAVFAGASGSFELIEDDGSPSPVEHDRVARTRMILDSDGGTFTILPTSGSVEVVPASRQFRLRFTGFAEPRSVSVTVAGRATAGDVTYQEETSTLWVDIGEVATRETAEVVFDDGMRTAANDVVRRVRDLLTQAQIEYDLKMSIDHQTQSAQSPALLIGQLQAMDLDPDLFGALSEVILADPHSFGT